MLFFQKNEKNFDLSSKAAHWHEKSLQIPRYLWREELYANSTALFHVHTQRTLLCLGARVAFLNVLDFDYNWNNTIIHDASRESLGWGKISVAASLRPVYLSLGYQIKIIQAISYMYIYSGRETSEGRKTRYTLSDIVIFPARSTESVNCSR